MSLSTNNFAKDEPTKGATPTSNSPTKSANSFTSDKPTKSNNIMLGDNTSSGPYGGDFGTFGDIFGAGVYGGNPVHFRNRTDPPAITH